MKVWLKTGLVVIVCVALLLIVLALAAHVHNEWEKGDAILPLLAPQI